MSERVYLDGVPMRLNSKFYPQPRPQFKEIDIHIPIDALQDDYDFSMERSVLIEVEAWQEQKRLEDERKAEELKRKAEEEERKRIEDEQKRIEEEEKRRLEEEELQRLEEERKLVEETERLKIEEETRKQLEENAKRIVEEEAKRIIEEEVKRKIAEEETLKNTEEGTAPKLEELKGTVEEQELEEQVEEESKQKSEEKYQLQAYVKNTRINVSEFESDTANPFDNVELKSINEMEMLASVLKNNSSSVPPSQNLEYRSDPHVTNTNYSNNGGAPSVYGNQGPPPSHQPTSCYPTGPYSMPTMPNAYPVQQWNTNSYYIPEPPSAPAIAGRYNPPVTAPTQMTNQSINVPTSTTNAFTKYYFPLLTSMADTRSMRDRQNQFSNNLNLNQGYSQSLPRSSGPTENRNPYLSSHSPLQPSPIQGSYSHQPSPYYWPNGASMTLQNNVTTNHSTPNGPLANDSLHKSNNSHPTSSTDLSASTSNGTLRSLR